MFKLYDYYRSSACFRVRIALNIKNIAYEQIPIHLLKDGGQQHSEQYQLINPQQLVPSLENTESQIIFTQSLAILEYLEENFLTPPLLPHDKVTRAKVRSIAQMVACDIHPLNNLRVLQFLKKDFQITDAQKKEWYFHWLRTGFNAIETFLHYYEKSGPYCFGKQPTMADICLIPQVYNAERFEFPISEFPFIKEVYLQCMNHPAFINALPENQPDAQNS